MTTPVTYRPDPAAERALRFLTRGGQSRSAVTREALVALHRQRLAERVQADAVRLATDQAYQQEVAELLAEDAEWEAQAQAEDEGRTVAG